MSQSSHSTSRRPRGWARPPARRGRCGRSVGRGQVRDGDADVVEHHAEATSRRRSGSVQAPCNTGTSARSTSTAPSADPSIRPRRGPRDRDPPLRRRAAPGPRGPRAGVPDGRRRRDRGRAGETGRAGPGALFVFDPKERHEVRASSDARLLLVLAPWPGAGHPGSRRLRPLSGGRGAGRRCGRSARRNRAASPRWRPACRARRAAARASR